MTRLVFCSIIFFAFAGINFAQNWNAEQQEVWASVKTYWALDDNLDFEGFSNYFDESYQGWSYDTDKPMNRTSVLEEIKTSYANQKPGKTTLSPLEIWVDGDMAFVHYTFVRERPGNDGSMETYKGRWTDILKKQGDKWILVGDHGGRWDKDDNNSMDDNQ